SSNDYYGIFGVSKAATTRQVKDAFLKLSLRFHPDKVPKTLRLDNKLLERTEKLYEKMQLAHDTLTNDAKRAAYARERLQALRGTESGKAEEKEEKSSHAR